MASSIVEFDWEPGESPQALANQFGALDDTLDERLREAMETLVVMIESTAKRLAPVDSGRLKSSMASEVEMEAETIIGTVGTNVSYAPAIEYGRGAIQADPGEVLHFFVEGEEVFTTSVDAAPAQPFLRPAFEAHRQDFERLVKGAIQQAVADVGLD